MGIEPTFPGLSPGVLSKLNYRNIRHPFGYRTRFGPRATWVTFGKIRWASVIGLAPIRSGLKGQSLELLCIHGQKSYREGERNVAARGQALTSRSRPLWLNGP